MTTITDNSSSFDSICGSYHTEIHPLNANVREPPRSDDTRMTRISRGATVMLMSDYFVPLCFVCALAVRLLWIAAIPVHPVNDGEWYVGRGMRIAAGRGYTVTDDGFPMGRPGHALMTPRPTAFWPIGYPAFLGVLFYVTTPLLPPLFAAQLSNALLYLGIMGSTAYFARKLFNSVLVGRLSLMLLAFLPNHVAYTALPLTEIWFTFLLSTGVAMIVWATERRTYWQLFAAGCVFGLAVLTKPQTILLPATVLLVVTWKREPPKAIVRHAVAVYVTLAMTIIPWTVRNCLAFGQFVFVSNNGGINLLIGNSPGQWHSNGFMWTDRLRRIVTTQTDEIARDRLARDAALEYITRHPASVLLKLPTKLASLYAFDIDGFGLVKMSAYSQSTKVSWLALRVFAQMYYTLIVGAAIIAAACYRHLRSAYAMVTPAMVVYFSVISLVFFGGPRFHFPILPSFVAYASAALAMILGDRRAGSDHARELTK
jgi:hypothetical protein